MAQERPTPRVLVLVGVLLAALVFVILRWGGEDGTATPARLEPSLLSKAEVTTGGRKLEIDLDSLSTHDQLEDALRKCLLLLSESEGPERLKAAIRISQLMGQLQAPGTAAAFSPSLLEEAQERLLKGLTDRDPHVAAHCANALVSLWRISPDPTTVQELRRGVSAYEAGQYEAALEAFRAAEQAVGPQPPDLYRMEAEAHLALSRPEEAASACERALKAQPAHFLALYDLARARLRKGDRKEAARALKRATAIYPGLPDAAELRRQVGDLAAGSQD